MFRLVCFIAVVTLAACQLDRRQYHRCNLNDMTSRLMSVHDNSREDRQYNFECRHIETYAENNCFWTAYVNDFDQAINYQCPPNYIIAGQDSYHDNGREDRRFKFRCCNPPELNVGSCYTTAWLNNWGGPLDWTVPTDRVLVGYESVHSNMHEDRRWKAKNCAYSIQ